MKNERKEGEYPFYPIRPEHPVLNPAKAMLLEDEETGQERHVIEYGHGFENTTGCLQWGNDF